MISEAKSGHPGIVLGAAPILYSLYAHHLKIDLNNPNFFNRDRFVMSAGHGSALLYATLYMAGYSLTLDDLKAFRQIDSKTPGHPEYKTTPGVEVTTGPLGQGFATAVGIAMAERSLAARFNKGRKEIIDFNTYVLCGDGDLMEGVSYEAASLAGTLKLNKLIVLYDSNDICLDGSTSQCFTENVAMRFIAQGWNVITVPDGNNIASITKAIEDAKNSSDKPTLIEVKTTIGKYSKLEGTNLVHGSPLEKEDITAIKEKMQIRDIPFTISQITMDDFQMFIRKRCKNLTEKFEKKVEGLEEEDKNALLSFIHGEKTFDIKDVVYEAPEDRVESTRVTSGKILSSVVPMFPSIIGGSADLFSATKTYVSEVGDFTSDNYQGRNIFFGVRENAMGAILNGFALCGYHPYGSTFLSFSDYLKPSIRLSCMMDLPVTYIFTHDSISVGPDGATHQPVEQLAGLRSTPNLEVFRPADANEVIGVYRTIFEKESGPSVIALSRNTVPILETTKINEVSKGGYIVFDSERKLSGILIATGEEVHLAIEVALRLQSKGLDIRVVSMPCIKRFEEQDQEYIDSILPVEIRKIVIEASSSMSWNNIVFNKKYLITLDEFGASGKKDDVYKKYGFDVDSLEEKVEDLLK
ncbi:MAG TPA: transketolase [Candidatus Faecimonas gallistercoris]|nr:transketolase [Candidatus Faecimonas gallistercoris]